MVNRFYFFLSHAHAHDTVFGERCTTVSQVIDEGPAESSSIHVNRAESGQRAPDDELVGTILFFFFLKYYNIHTV